jgi:hypothetical protein
MPRYGFLFLADDGSPASAVELLFANDKAARHAAIVSTQHPERHSQFGFVHPCAAGTLVVLDDDREIARTKVDSARRVSRPPYGTQAKTPLTSGPYISEVAK